MNVSFEESGMTFSFPEEQLYRIEKDTFVNKAEGFAVCECVVRSTDGKLWLIEAKSSSPKPDGLKGEERFRKFIKEITKKFADTLTVYNAVLLRHNADNIPGVLRKPTAKDCYQLYLIINGHKAEWLPAISNALKSELRGLLYVWHIEDKDVKVINEQIAKSKGLIEDFISKDAKS